MFHDFRQGEVILLDKPYGWTSFDAVNKVRVALKYDLKINPLKVGHAGTLDPLATGLLIICTGKFTKRIDEFQGLPKVYSGTFVLGSTRPSHDMETETDSESGYQGVTEQAIRAAVDTFKGVVLQIPPVHSAIKVDGKRAYNMTRKNREVKLDAREVTISRFEITNILLPEVDFEIECSKGTYIRAIARDLGEILGCGAYLSSLRRLSIGSFDISNALSVESFMEEINAIRHSGNNSQI